MSRATTARGSARARLLGLSVNWSPMREPIDYSDLPECSETVTAELDPWTRGALEAACVQERPALSVAWLGLYADTVELLDEFTVWSGLRGWAEREE